MTLLSVSSPMGERFPFDDMPPEAASTVVNVLSDPEALTSFHRQAEITNILYPPLHAALLAAAIKTYDSQEVREAFCGGVGIYEAAGAVLLSPRTYATDIGRQVVKKVVGEFAKGSSQFLGASIAEYSVAKLKADTPRASAAFEKLGDQYEKDLAPFVVAGVACARRLEVRTIRSLDEAELLRLDAEGEFNLE